MTWLLYGAYGYTGRLILESALARGMRPVLGGRDEERLSDLAERHGLRHRSFALDDPADVRDGVEEMEAVLNAAGPHSATFDPMVRACLAEGAHYLDITGEIPVLERSFALDDEAREAEIVIVCGVAFDVVPTDCLAARVARTVEEPVRLDLAFVTSGGPSRGTARTVLERIGDGGKARRGGEIVDMRLGWTTRRVPFSDGERRCVAIPWGDISTAYRSTGVPDVRVFTPIPPATLTALRLGGPLLRIGPVSRMVRGAVDRWVEGPDEDELEEGGARVWCEVHGAEGDVEREEIVTPNPYLLTGDAAAAAMKRVLEGAVEEPGTYTPSQAFGPGFVFALDGVKRIELYE